MAGIESRGKVTTQQIRGLYVASTKNCGRPLTTEANSLAQQKTPEERNTVEGCLLPHHVLGGHSSVFVCNLPVTDVGSVSDEW